MAIQRHLARLIVLAFAGCAGPLYAGQIELALPIACELGQTCLIQNYVDRDPSGNARDYACGGQTYDGHNGIDIRLPSMAQQRAGVAVRAAADGVVLRTRDAMPDISVREIGIDQVKGRECGNGLILQHSDGFESEYCHMARGSLQVKPGDVVKAGQTLGSVGLSGQTEFAHLHFTLRRNGKVIDPFAYGADDTACNGGASLWDSKLTAALAYRPIAILNKGFAAQPVDPDQIDASDIAAPPAGPDAPNLVAYVRAIALRAGDVQRLVVVDPDGNTLASNAIAPLERNKAQYSLTAGSKRPPGGWKRGLYRATYRVERDGAPVIEETFQTRL
jgi:hypothetical protein